jgi:hypothetical protein
MSDMVKNLAKLLLALLISWIISFGIVFAQPLCCRTISDSCISASNRIQTDAALNIKCRSSVSHNRGATQLWIIVSELSPNNVSAKSSCCENEPCDGFDLTLCYNNSSQQGSVLRVKDFDSFHATNGLQNTLNQKSQSIPLHPTSIYILTRSIIC